MCCVMASFYFFIPTEQIVLVLVVVFVYSPHAPYGLALMSGVFPCVFFSFLLYRRLIKFGFSLSACTSYCNDFPVSAMCGVW